MRDYLEALAGVLALATIAAVLICSAAAFQPPM
jgi:hypothetical protein